MNFPIFFFGYRMAIVGCENLILASVYCSSMRETRSMVGGSYETYTKANLKNYLTSYN